MISLWAILKIYKLILFHCEKKQGYPTIQIDQLESNLIPWIMLTFDNTVSWLQKQYSIVRLK